MHFYYPANIKKNEYKWELCHLSRHYQLIHSDIKKVTRVTFLSPFMYTFVYLMSPLYTLLPRYQYICNT